MWITSQSIATTKKRSIFYQRTDKGRKKYHCRSRTDLPEQDYYCTPTQRCCCEIATHSKADKKNEQRTGKKLSENAAHILISLGSGNTPNVFTLFHNTSTHTNK